MPAPYSSEDRERYQAYLNVHLKNKEYDLPPGEKIEILEKRLRNKWWMLGVNVLAILFFGYSFFYGITQLSDTLLYILLAVFVVNMGLIFYQRNQLKELIAYLKWKQDESTA